MGGALKSNPHVLSTDNIGQDVNLADELSGIILDALGQRIADNPTDNTVFICVPDYDTVLTSGHTHIYDTEEVHRVRLAAEDVPLFLQRYRTEPVWRRRCWPDMVQDVFHARERVLAGADMQHPDYKAFELEFKAVLATVIPARREGGSIGWNRRLLEDARLKLIDDLAELVRRFSASPSRPDHG